MLGLDRVHCGQKNKYKKKKKSKKKIISSFHLYHLLSLCHNCSLCSILQLSVVLWFSSVGFNAHPHGLFGSCFAYLCGTSTGSTQESEEYVLLNITLYMCTFVKRVLVLPRKVVIIPFRRFRFYFKINILIGAKKWKIDNSSMYDVVSNHNFWQTFKHFDEVYLNQNSDYLWTAILFC